MIYEFTQLPLLWTSLDLTKSIVCKMVSVIMFAWLSVNNSFCSIINFFSKFLRFSCVWLIDCVRFACFLHFKRHQSNPWNAVKDLSLQHFKCSFIMCILWDDHVTWRILVIVRSMLDAVDDFSPWLICFWFIFKTCKFAD